LNSFVRARFVPLYSFLRCESTIIRFSIFFHRLCSFLQNPTKFVEIFNPRWIERIMFVISRSWVLLYLVRCFILPLDLLLLLLIMYTVVFWSWKKLHCFSDVSLRFLSIACFYLSSHLGFTNNASCDVGLIVWGDEKGFLSQVGLWLLRLVQRLTVDTMV
jgi:hypothetical protein